MENNKQIIIGTDGLDGVVEMERLYYETTARANIIGFMVSSNMTETISYKKYWEEYLSYLKEYEEFKNVFTKKNGLDKYGDKTWTLDFQNNRIIIE